jgi:sulfate adenylyltransferase
MAADLIPPHGGTLVNRYAADADALRAKAASLTKVPVSAADLSTVYRWADGTLSPMTGPMTHAVYDRVLDEKVVEAGGKKLAWTIPLSLPVTAELVDRLGGGQTVALTNPRGDIVATLDVESVFAWDKPRYLQAVYGTDRTDHPGADMVLKNPDNADKTHLIGGTIEVIRQNEHPEFREHIKTPRQIRDLLQTKGWDAVVAFQTRNPLHRAHEYALVYGLETLLRQGKNAGAVLNPLLGETKGDDVSAAIRMQTYERLIANRELGQGDSDPELWKKVGGSAPDRVLLLGLDIKMFYGGPSEAVMHAIYRQNMGFTHIIIGRKHADAPYHDGSPIWGDFDAQDIFDQLGGDLLIQPVKVGFAAFYESAGRVDLMSNHEDEKPVFISGQQVRATLLAGEMVDPRIMRPSTSAILAQAMKQG